MSGEPDASRDDDLAHEVRELRREVVALTERVRAMEAYARGAPPRPQPPAPAPGPASAAHGPAVRGPPVAPAAPAAPAKRRAGAQSLLAANWLAVAGAIVLVLGVAFFLRYAFEHDWIGLRARILLGVVAGLALVATGDVLGRRGGFGAFPQVVSASGVAITAFSVFAAHHFEPYRDATGLGAAAASVLLSVTALAFGAYAAWRNAPALAGVGVVLAAVTAFAADAWTGVGVVYAVVLGAAFAGAAAWRGWPHVALVTALSTFTVLAVDVAEQETRAVVLVAAAVFTFGAHALAGVLIARHRDPAPRGFVPWVPAVAGVAAWGVTLLAIVVEDATGGTLETAYPGLDAGATLAFAGVFLGLALTARAVPHAFATGAGVAGVIALLAWPPLAFEDEVIALAWGALVAVATGIAWSAPGARTFARWTALAAGALATFTLVAGALEWFPSDAPAVTFLAYAIPAVALAAAWFVDRTHVAERHARLHPLFLTGTVLVVTTYLGHALDGYRVSAAWALLGLALMVAGLVRADRELRWAALALFALTLFRLFTIDLGTLDLGYRIIAFLVVGALLLVASAVYARAQRAGQDE